MRFTLRGGPRRRSRDEILHEFQSTLKLHEVLINKLSVEKRGLIDYEHSPYRSSGYEAELIPQDRLAINQLSMHKVHEGKYILCRLVAGSYQLTSVTTVIEDPTGTIDRLCLFNWSDPDCVEAQNLSTRRYIPIGTILVIRNPHYTLGTDTYPIIRSENPFDVIIIKNHHPILQGITWYCQPIHNMDIMSPTMNRYGLSSDQIAGYQLKKQSSPNVMLTPPASANGGRIKGVRGLHKKSKRHRNKKHEHPLVLINPAGGSRHNDNNVIVACCLLFLVWFIFFPY